MEPVAIDVDAELVDVESSVSCNFDANLSALRDVLPHKSDSCLREALCDANGDLERAMNRLLEAPPCQPGSSSTDLTMDEDAHAGSRSSGAMVNEAPSTTSSSELYSLLCAHCGERCDPHKCREGDDALWYCDKCWDDWEKDPLEVAAQAIESVLPDCDPGHLRQVLHETNSDQNAALERILAAGSYPKRAQKGSAASSSSSPSSSSAAPARDAAYWFDSTKRSADGGCSRTYAETAQQLLLHEFGEFGKPGIVKLLRNSSGFYAIAWKICYDSLTEILEGRPPQAPLQKLKCPRKSGLQKPVLRRNSLLYDEREFVQQWQEQGKREAEREAARAAYLKQCEVNGLLLECECCFGENLGEDTIQCPAGHLFCKRCTRQYIETQMSGDTGVPRLVCPSTAGCVEVLAPSELRRVLPEEVLSNYEKRLQKASIEKAMLESGLSSIEKCPFCDFAMEMELSPEENKVFICQAADCGKESCRLCKEENHIPLKCKEVEKKAQTSHRLTVEERMTEALIRECPSCKAKGVTSRFVKTDGCNKMTCPKCKGFVCYLCSEAIDKKIGYGHFCQHPLDPGKGCNKCTKCALWSGSTEKDLQKAESERVAREGLQAHEEYKAAHTEEELPDDLEVLQNVPAAGVPPRGQKRKAPPPEPPPRMNQLNRPPNHHQVLARPPVLPGLAARQRIRLARPRPVLPPGEPDAAEPALPFNVNNPCVQQ